MRKEQNSSREMKETRTAQEEETMNTNEILDNETITERKNPVTLRSVLGLIALIVLALVLCAPYARIPGNGEPAKAPVAIEASVDTVADEPIL